MSTQDVTIQENLFKFDNLLTALNYLIEEATTRKDNILTVVREEMYTVDFQSRILETIRDEYGDNLYRDVAFIVMEKIDGEIEKFLNSRVDSRLRELGIIPAANGG